MSATVERDTSESFGHPRPWRAEPMDVGRAWQVTCPSRNGDTRVRDVVADWLSRADAEVIARAGNTEQ